MPPAKLHYKFVKDGSMEVQHVYDEAGTNKGAVEEGRAYKTAAGRGKVHEIDWIKNGAVQRGIYRVVDAKTVQILLPENADAPRPAGFDVPPDSGHLLVKLVRTDAK